MAPLAPAPFGSSGVLAGWSGAGFVEESSAPEPGSGDVASGGVAPTGSSSATREGAKIGGGRAELDGIE